MSTIFGWVLVGLGLGLILALVILHWLVNDAAPPMFITPRDLTKEKKL